MSISKVILQILRRSPQGFTPFEILDYLHEEPPYQARSRHSLFSELLTELQRLRNSQIITHVSHRWVLVEFVKNNSVELLQSSKEAAQLEKNQSDDEYLDKNFQEWTPKLGEKVLVRDRGTTLFVVSELIYVGNSLRAELVQPDILVKIKKPISELIPANRSQPEQKNKMFEGSKSATTTGENNYAVDKKSVDVPIETLNLSLRSYNRLKMAGISTIRELQSFSEDRLLRIKNFGQNSLAEVREALTNFQPEPQPAQTEKAIQLPEWANLPTLQMPPRCLAVSSSVLIIVSQYLTIAHLIYEFEGGAIKLDSRQYAELKVAITPFQVLRDADGDYRDWLASLSESAIIQVLTKNQWTPDRLKELSPCKILLKIPVDDRATTHQAIISGKIPSKRFTTIAEEIEDWLNLLDDKQKFVLKERLGWQYGNHRSLVDIAQELEITRERVRQIEEQAKKKLNILKPWNILLQLSEAAIDTLEAASCISRFEDWCEAIAMIYPPGEVHLPSVMSWLVEFIPVIDKIKISESQLFYIAPITRNILSDIQTQLAEFWESQKISDGLAAPSVSRRYATTRHRLRHEAVGSRARLQQLILPLLPEQISKPSQVADLLITTLCHSPIPGIFSEKKWELKDYAYYVIHEAGKSLHFSEIGQRIKQIKPDWQADNIERAAQGLVDRHPEIIRSGSGMYGLREWGTMEYGHFREVLLDYLSKQPLPIDVDELYHELSQSYQITRATVTMNLSFHPDLFNKFGSSNFYGITDRHYSLPDEKLLSLLVARLELGPVRLYELEQEPDFCKYDRNTLYLYLNFSPLFWQVGSFKEKKFALATSERRQYQPGDASKIIAHIFNQICEPLHPRDFLHIIGDRYAYPPGESAFWRTIAAEKKYITIGKGIFIPQKWMRDETLSPIFSNLDTKLFRKILLFTKSAQAKRPSDNILFEWLNFCYQNRFFYRGSLVFAEINLSKLSDNKAQIASEIGEACQHHGEISLFDL